MRCVCNTPCLPRRITHHLLGINPAVHHVLAPVARECNQYRTGRRLGVLEVVAFEGTSQISSSLPDALPSIGQAIIHKISTSTRMGGLPERWVEQLTQPDADNTTFSPLNPLANTVLSVTTQSRLTQGNVRGLSGFGVRLTGESQFQRMCR